jgi:two-component system, NtrC family, sensor histidine kinase PilS
MLDPRRIVRWVYLGRFSVATSIFVAAQLVWASAPTADTRIASLIFAVTMVFTVASAAYSDVYRAPLGRTFLYLQTVFDLVLVTAVVHLTGGGSSQFALFYILVIACAALLLPIGGGLLVALLGIVCYFAEVLWLGDSAPDLGVWLQLMVFGVVALACGYISARLQEAGAGTAAELSFVRLQAEDILRNIKSGIVTIDTNGVLLYANPTADVLLGLPLAEMIGSPILGRIGEVSPAIARALESAATAQVRTTRAEDFISIGGEAFPVGVTTTFSDSESGAATRTATAIFQDISGQKRLESLHLRAERLEAIAELSASLAHEIRNPLASIRSAVEQLTAFFDQPAAAPYQTSSRRSRRQESNGASIVRTRSNGHVATGEEDARTLGTLIMRETDRLTRLLSEFLDFARVRVSRMSNLDVTTIARGAANLVAAHPDVKEGLRVMCLVPERPVIVEGDGDLLHQAAFNLALNAVQAAPAGGEVLISVAELKVEELPSGVGTGGGVFEVGAVALSVSDDGPGIAPDVRDRLFEPFVSTKRGGSGLGLSVVHRAIEAHRGVVLVDSGTSGTKVTVLLPYSQLEELSLPEVPAVLASDAAMSTGGDQR